MSLERFAQLFGRKIDRHAELFENIGAAAAGCNPAIAMLHHHRSAGCHHECHRGRDIKQIEAVAPGPANVDHRAGHLGRIDHRVDCALHQRADKSRNFFRRFSFVMQSGQELRFRLVVDFRRKQQRDRVTDLGAVEIEFVAQLFGQRVQSKPRRPDYAVWRSIWRIHSR